MARARSGGGYPISHWSHSSLLAYLRNPLAWYKRYVEKIYDTPSSPAGVVGRAGHVALQHFYGGIAKEGAIDLGMEYLRSVPDFEVNFGVARTKFERKKKRQKMEREFLQMIGYYLEKPPRYDVVGIEVKATAAVPGVPIPLKAVSDLVVRSRTHRGALDIVDHKFVESFSNAGKDKTLFILQAIFNYYTIKEMYGQPVKRFILHECRKRQNMDGSKQMRRYIISYDACAREFEVFHRLLRDASEEIRTRRTFLPNPSDMFEGENSFDVYRLGLVGGS